MLDYMNWMKIFEVFHHFSLGHFDITWNQWIDFLSLSTLNILWNQWILDPYRWLLLPRHHPCYVRLVSKPIDPVPCRPKDKSQMPWWVRCIIGMTLHTSDRSYADRLTHWLIKWLPANNTDSMLTRASYIENPTWFKTYLRWRAHWFRGCL